MKQRDIVIDGMRAMAMVLLFAAHSGFPGWFENWREFALVIFFFISGISFSLSSFTWSKENYWNYLKKRVFRLLVPLYIYLTLFFCLFHFIPGYDFSWKEIFLSYALTAGGILFVWVYRIFLGTAITLPVMQELGKNSKPWKVVFLSILALIGNDLLYRYVFCKFSYPVEDLLTYAVTYTIGYAIITYLGARWNDFSNKEKWLFILLNFGIYIALGIHNHFATLYPYSFPPQLYWISYGLAWTGLFYMLLKLFYKKPNAIVSWISKYSMRLYLAHITVYYLIINKVPYGFQTFFILFGVSVVLVLIYNKLERHLQVKKH